MNGQGNDRGTQYRTGVYTHTEEQMAAAKERFGRETVNFRRPIASELQEAEVFWPAEDYHQVRATKKKRVRIMRLLTLVSDLMP